ncbi:hypothetical protein SORBI_3010G122533 [Sorghum bicolor]|uniref:Uncharacterized protein n=1 Tax=Sorghum bicolor TaxID=4558 RepID=A0A1W0VSK3_SORBI|nr:hypothetical protein SORBI_3010G122533 [Sorghum bicolor]
MKHTVPIVAGNRKSKHGGVSPRLPLSKPTPRLLVRDEALLEPDVAHGYGDEDDGGEEGMDPVERLEAALLELAAERLEQLALLPLGEAEHVEPPRERHAVVDLALVDDAVGEGEEDAGGGEEGDEQGAEPLVGDVAGALVGEGRRQRLEHQHRARRQQLRQVRRHRQHLLGGHVHPAGFLIIQHDAGDADALANVTACRVVASCPRGIAIIVCCLLRSSIWVDGVVCHPYFFCGGWFRVVC